MSRLQFLAALTLGCALLISGCAAPEAPSSPGSTTPLETTNPVSPGPSPTQFGTDADPETPKLEIAAQLTVDLTGSDPAATDIRGVEVSGNLVTGGMLTASLEPGQTLALLILGKGKITTRAQLDNSIPVLVSEQFELGLGPPHVVTTSGQNASFDWDTEQYGSELTYTFTLRPDSAPAALAIPIGQNAATAAVWTSGEGGKSLQVSPSDWGRNGGMTVGEFGWQSVVAFAPDGDSDSMRNQFQCHAIGAPTKTYWNLEPWRPDVGLLQFMAKRCNP